MPLFMRIGRALSARLKKCNLARRSLDGLRRSLAGAPMDRPAFSSFADAFNASVEKLNARTFAYLDDAVAGER